MLFHSLSCYILRGSPEAPISPETTQLDWMSQMLEITSSLFNFIYLFGCSCLLLAAVQTLSREISIDSSNALSPKEFWIEKNQMRYFQLLTVSQLIRKFEN